MLPQITVIIVFFLLVGPVHPTRIMQQKKKPLDLDMKKTNLLRSFRF